MSEMIEIISDKAKKELEELTAKLSQSAEMIEKINKNKIDVVPSKVEKNIKGVNKQTSKLNAHQKEAERLNNALSRQQAKLNRSYGKQNQKLQKLRFETNKNNRESKQRAIISSKLASDYQKEQAKISLLSDRYKDLASKQQRGIKLSKKEEKELKDTTRQINRKQAALKRVDANIGNFQRNVGNYTSAWGRLIPIMRNLLLAFGAFSAIEIGRQIFNQTKEITKLNNALKQVTESTKQFVQAQSFLERVSIRTGASLNSLQKGYVNFLAAAKVTNLTLFETQRIFEAVTTAGALLGQSTKDVAGALRALQQMLSKGKVQAEEIRGQLGERLPGAYQILARSMGITTEELSKQLELGQVYADEVLPKFAKELEKTYSLETIDKVENLAAAQGRLGNEWNLFIRDLEKGGLGKFLGGILDLLSLTIKGFRGLIDTVKEANKIFEGTVKGIDILTLGVTGIVRNFKKFGLAAKLTKIELTEFRKELDSFQKKMRNGNIDVDKYKKKTQELKDRLKDVRFNTRQARQAVSDYENGLNDVTEAEAQQARAILITEKTLIGQIKARNENLALLNDEEKAVDDTKEAYKEFQSFLESRDKTNDVQFGSIRYYEELIKKLKKVQEIYKNNPAMFQALQKEIDKTEKFLEGLIRHLNGESFDAESALMEAAKNATDEFANTKRSVDELSDSLKELAGLDILKGELFDLAGMLNINGEKIEGFFEDYESEARAAALATTEVIGGIGQTMHENELIRIDNQIQANRRRYNQEIQMAEGNQEQQESLRREQERNEQELLARRAKAQQDAVLFEIAINTAAAVVKVLPDIPLSIAIAAIGAAKAAVVESRPIPQYEKGTDNADKGYAIVGEKENEPILDKQGNLKGISPDKPTLTYLEKGDQVLPSMDDLQKDINNQLIASNVIAGSKPKQQQADNKQIAREVIKTLRKAKFVNNNVTKVDLNQSLWEAKFK